MTIMLHFVLAKQICRFRIPIPYIHGDHEVHKAGIAQVGALVFGCVHHDGSAWWRAG